MSAPRDPDWEARIRASFAAQAMVRTLDARILSLAPGEVALTAPITDRVIQQHGYAHAALAFALGDTAAGYAALSLAAPGDEVLTVEIKINLLAPATGDALVARGRVERAGRTLSVVRADVFARSDAKERAVAAMLGTMALRPPPPSSSP